MNFVKSSLWTFYFFLLNVKFNSGIALSSFYPYGQSHGDRRVPTNDDGSSPKITVSTLFPYFNQQFNSLYVNTNGAISFSKPLSTYTPSPFPLTDNRKIVAPFWCDIDTRKGGDVWFYETNDQNLLYRASDDVKKIFPEQANFHAGWLFVATWDNVAFYGASSAGRNKRNTFQCILITNGRHSFTIFLYNKVQWTTGTASNGNADTGLGGTPAQVGFDAGDGINFNAINESRTSRVINVPQLSNVGVQGKFVYRIDTETVQDGGCSMSTGGTLSIFPRYGTMFGGTHLSVGGPCISESDKVSIKFKETNNAIPCSFYSKFSVKCVSPKVYRTGEETVTLYVAHVNGNMSTFRGVYTFINPATAKSVIHRVNPKEWKTRQIVTIRWQSLPFEDDTLAIELYKLKNINGTPALESDGYITKGIAGDETNHSFNLNTTGQAAVLRIHGEQLDGPFVWSEMFVVKPSNPKEILSMCNSWFDAESNKLELDRNNFDTCPCTITQARLDISRFNPDPQCNNLEKTDKMQVNCIYQINAIQCVRMAFASEGGHDNQCCYDKTGNLIKTSPDVFGGTAHRYHFKGGTQENIPFLSNMQNDIVPYMYCCQYLAYYNFSNSDHCKNFLQRRPPSRCTGYVPPRLASTRGDPHMVTLDGLDYTFNGVGEFTLLTSMENNFTAQTRMEQFLDNNGNPKPASVITSIVLRCSNDSDVIEVRLNSIRLCDVLQNGELIDFSQTNTVEVKGSTILSSNENETDTNNIWTLITCKTPNIAINVSASSKMININVVIADIKLRGAVSGLLGNFNGRKDDDLTTPNGQVIPTNSSLQDIHYKFGLKWSIAAADSLFTYPVGKTHQSFQKLHFQPTFNVRNQCPGNVTNVCGNDEACRFDFCTTGDATVAATTRRVTEEIKVIDAVSLPVCGIPGNITNGYWNFTGKNAELVCNTNYIPDGPTLIKCSNDGFWGKVNTSCEITPCEELSNVTNGFWTNVTNRTASFLCNDNYVIKENISIICLLNGSWIIPSNANEACELIACKDIANVPHGIWTFTERTANLICDKRYVQKQNITIKCQQNGSWDIPSKAYQACVLFDAVDEKTVYGKNLPILIAVPVLIVFIIICILVICKKYTQNRNNPKYEMDEPNVEPFGERPERTLNYCNTHF